MSMWSETKDTLVAYKSEGSACKYADREMGGLAAPTAQTPYILSKNYCAVNRGMFGGGEICGACFRLTYKGDHEQGLGRPGSDVIQVVDSGSWATFDCHMTAFHKITDYNTGFFPVTYEQVPCETSAGGPVAGVLHSDYYISKLVFSNLRYPVKSATLSIGGEKYPLKLVGGWWHVWTGPAKGSVTFRIVEQNGQEVTISSCFGGWQNRKAGDGCSGHHSHHDSASEALPAPDFSALQEAAPSLEAIRSNNLTQNESSLIVLP